MIKLGVEEYCHNCTEFYPEFDENVLRDYYGSVYIANTDRYVVCKNEKLCRHIKDHLMKSIKIEEK